MTSSKTLNNRHWDEVSAHTTKQTGLGLVDCVVIKDLVGYPGSPYRVLVSITPTGQTVASERMLTVNSLEAGEKLIAEKLA